MRASVVARGGCPRRRCGERARRAWRRRRSTWIARRCAPCSTQHADVNAAAGRRHDGAALGGAIGTIWRRPTLLVKAGADVKAANRYGVTPLSLACTNGDGAMVELLLKAGADANTTLPGGETALMTAARTGKVAAVEALLAHGAEVDAKESHVRADGADVGGGGRQRGGGAGAAEGGRGPARAARLAASRRCCSRCAKDASAWRARCWQLGADLNETIQRREPGARRAAQGSADRDQRAGAGGGERALRTGEHAAGCGRGSERGGGRVDARCT